MRARGFRGLLLVPLVLVAGCEGDQRTLEERQVAHCQRVAARMEQRPDVTRVTLERFRAWRLDEVRNVSVFAVVDFDNEDQRTSVVKCSYPAVVDLDARRFSLSPLIKAHAIQINGRSLSDSEVALYNAAAARDP